MTKTSVNIQKINTLQNSGRADNPNVVQAGIVMRPFEIRWHNGTRSPNLGRHNHQNSDGYNLPDIQYLQYKAELQVGKILFA